ncbi:CoA transferase [Mycobacterium cookii]|nr:CoA transferase [Mycobacterium cookii]
MATGSRDATGLQREIHSAEVFAALSEWLSGIATKEVVALFGGRVPIGPVNTVADIYANPHVAAREMLVQVEQPGSNRPIALAGQPIKFTDTPAGVDRRAPLLGEHSLDEFLSRWSGPHLEAPQS